MFSALVSNKLLQYCFSLTIKYYLFIAILTSIAKILLCNIVIYLNFHFSFWSYVHYRSTSSGKRDKLSVVVVAVRTTLFSEEENSHGTCTDTKKEYTGVAADSALSAKASSIFFFFFFWYSTVGLFLFP